MKNQLFRQVILFTFCLLTSVFFLQAQPPLRFSYQSIIRNPGGQALPSQPVAMRLSILQTSETGTAVYVETHTATTNASGLVSLQVGGGTIVSGSMAAIDWATGPYFIKTETDPDGGSNYSITGTSQLMSVPYALFSSNGIPTGTSTNEILYWDGTAWKKLNPGSNGQILTICNGVLTWTNGGVCPTLPGTITALNCTSATHNGILSLGNAASGVNSIVPYTGGNGGIHTGQEISSTWVTGLTATVTSGDFANGSGILTYNINGTPDAAGFANFSLNIGGQTCMLIRTVNGGDSTASCGAAKVHNPNLSYGTMTDQDGNIYKTILIGTQEWMAENLKASHYRNGDLIPLETNNITWGGLITGASCWYNNDSLGFNCPYGKIYNWYATADPRNLCPNGWHLPSDAEWIVLTNFLGGESVAGGKMKSTATQYWFSPNQEATNASGFSGLPGGFRGTNGTFGWIGYSGLWWSSTSPGAFSAWTRRLHYNFGSVITAAQNTVLGFSVRCLRD